MPELMDRVIDDLVVRHGADGILACNDEWAAGLCKAARRRGVRVPEQLRVVGFDNLTLVAEASTPALTSIDERSELILPRMLDTLLRWTAEGRLPASQRASVVTPTLVVREST